ncbi:MAG: hypothetical protein KJ880_05905 [Candidatus Omnitrophica bacterium]|nr:hypothetical protein [Candidatus Omnitrophota bacterium]MBU1869844.1 hypothetical protein [Candidatus Omnitrophota bacterium]
MNTIISVIISFLSIIVEISLIIKYYTQGGISGLEGAGWLISVLGAPTTFLQWILYKTGVTKGYIPSLIALFLLYLLQYQVIAFLIYKKVINFNSIGSLIFVIILILVIVFSAIIMWNIIMGKFI